jgi:hypothetical protein
MFKGGNQPPVRYWIKGNSYMDNGVENYESVLAHGLVSTNGRQVKVNAVLCVGYILKVHPCW